MVTKLIGSDEKTTKYILDNKIINDKENDLNINIRKIIMNSPILQKIRQSQNQNLFSKIIQDKTKRNESSDSSEEKIIKKIELNEENKEIDVFISNSTSENKNKIDNDLKFTFSPLKSIALSRIDTQGKNNKIFSDEDLKNKEAKNINFFELFKIPDNYSNNTCNESDKQISEKLKIKKLVKNLDNKLIPYESEEMNLPNEVEDEKDNSNIVHKHIRIKSNLGISEKVNENIIKVNTGIESPSSKIKAAKKLSINLNNLGSKLIDNNIRNPYSSSYESNNELIKNKKKISISKGFDKENKPIQISRGEKIHSSMLNNNSDNINQNMNINPLGSFNIDARSDKQSIKSIEEFKKIRAKRVKNHSIISAHSIIDYSINKSDYLSVHERKRNNSSAINLLDKDEKERSLLINEKIKIGNKKIKELISKTKEKGHFGPYFSLCKNCNERNNLFYEKINVKNAIGILKVINDS